MVVKNSVNVAYANEEERKEALKKQYKQLHIRLILESENHGNSQEKTKKAS